MANGLLLKIIYLPRDLLVAFAGLAQGASLCAQPAQRRPARGRRWKES